MTSRVDLHPAFVLHQRRYGETSLLVEAWSLHHGRVGLVARGARRPRAAWSGILHPFRPLALAWTGAGEMGTLVGAEADGPPFTLTGSRLYCGFYLNELLVRLLPRHDPYPALQGHYRAAVGGLAAGEPVDVCLRLFEMRLLAALGYGLALALDSGAAVDPDREYYYVQEQGPQLTVPASAPFVTVQGATLLALQGMDLTAPAVQAEAKRLLRFALAPYLGERPLASRALFSKVLLR